MNFVFENEGANSFLVYPLGQDEEIDSLGFGMLTNNRIVGVLPLVYARKDANRYFRFNISSKISLSSFLSRQMNKKRVVALFSSLCSAFLEAQEYMLEPNVFITNPDDIFVDVSTNDVYLVGMPLVPPVTQHEDLRQCCKSAMFRMQFDQSENCDYVTTIINFLNREDSFSLRTFRTLLFDLQKGASGQVREEVFQNQESARPQTQYSSPANHPAFQTAAARGVGVTAPPPAQSAAPTAFESSMPAATPAPPKKKGIFGGLFEKKEKKPAKSSRKPQKKNAKKPAKSPKRPAAAGVGFAVPGMAPPDSPAPQGGAMDTMTEEEKFKAFFSQQVIQPIPEKKERHFPFGGKKKKTPPPQKAVTPPFPSMTPPPPKPAPPVAPPPPPVAAPASAVQTPPPKPYHQDAGFGNTTVLASAGSHQTILLSAEDSALSQKEPYLLRQKNGEMIPIGKPIFVIGKEAGFVDYCIQDNETISRNHASIIVGTDSYYVEDTNSLNHTYIDGTQIPSNHKVRIQEGADLCLSNEHFTFVLR